VQPVLCFAFDGMLEDRREQGIMPWPDLALEDAGLLQKRSELRWKEE
jgi:hypothetical protein